jgi:hypothetical protein
LDGVTFALGGICRKIKKQNGHGREKCPAWLFGNIVSPNLYTLSRRAIGSPSAPSFTRSTVTLRYRFHGELRIYCAAQNYSRVGAVDAAMVDVGIDFSAVIIMIASGRLTRCKETHLWLTIRKSHQRH